MFDFQQLPPLPRLEWLFDQYRFPRGHRLQREPYLLLHRECRRLFPHKLFRLHFDGLPHLVMVHFPVLRNHGKLASVMTDLILLFTKFLFPFVRGWSKLLD